MFEKWAEKFRARAEEDDVTFKDFDERVAEPAPAPITRKVEEIKHTKRGRLVEKLKVKNDGAVVEKIVGNGADLFEGLGSYYLKLNIARAIA